MNFTKSALNYTGGKFRLLKEIIPLFPKDIDTFIDVFGGSGTVSLNVNATNKIYNELDSNVYNIINIFKCNLTLKSVFFYRKQLISQLLPLPLRERSWAAALRQRRNARALR